MNYRDLARAVIDVQFYRDRFITPSVFTQTIDLEKRMYRRIITSMQQSVDNEIMRHFRNIDDP